MHRLLPGCSSEVSKSMLLAKTTRQRDLEARRGSDLNMGACTGCLQAASLPPPGAASGQSAAVGRLQCWRGNVLRTLGISRQSPLAPAVRHPEAWGRLHEAETASKAKLTKVKRNQRFGERTKSPQSEQKIELWFGVEEKIRAGDFWDSVGSGSHDPSLLRLPLSGDATYNGLIVFGSHSLMVSGSSDK